MNELFLIGPMRPEMECIRTLLEDAGYATQQALHNGHPVTQTNAGQTDPMAVSDTDEVIGIECRIDGQDHEVIVARACDNHRHFLVTSTLGAVVTWLARRGDLPEDWTTRPMPRDVSGLDNGAIEYWSRGWWVADTLARQYLRIPHELVVATATDYDLVAAYAGRCPSVTHGHVEAFRRRQIAKRRGLSMAAVRESFKAARDCLEQAPVTDGFSDVRGHYIPELFEVALSRGTCIVASVPDQEERERVFCQAGTPEDITRFMEQWAPAHGLSGIYGSPTCGYAGGYI